jgi:hypothetical protein
MQERKNGKVVLLGKPIDYILVRGLTAVKDATSPCRVTAVYPQDDSGQDLSDHAIVTVKVRT